MVQRLKIWKGDNMTNKFNYDTNIQAAIFRINGHLDQIDPVGVNMPRYFVQGLSVGKTYSDSEKSFVDFSDKDQLSNYLRDLYLSLIEPTKAPAKFYDLILTKESTTDFESVVKNTEWGSIAKIEVVDLGDLVQIAKIGLINVWFSASFNEYVFN